MWSLDGLTWEGKVTCDEFQGEFTDVLFNGNRTVAVGFGVTGAAGSTGGWSFSNASALGLTGVAWSGNHFLAVGIGGIYRSTDGLSWTKASDTPYMPRSVAWSGYQYVAVGFVSPILMVSP
jgi:hypothetical protein